MIKRIQYIKCEYQISGVRSHRKKEWQIWFLKTHTPSMSKIKPNLKGKQLIAKNTHKCDINR